MKLKKVEKSENQKIQPQLKTLLAQVEWELGNDGIKPLNESIEEEYLSFPTDFSSLPTTEVGRYLNAYTQKKSSVRVLITKYEILLEEANAELDKHKARIYNDLPAKMSVTEKELKLISDPDAQISLEMCRKLRAKVLLAETYYETLKDAIFNVSRHISMNISDNDDEKREHNVGQVKRGWK